MIGLVGQKLGMTRILSDDGSATPVSVIKIEPNRIVQAKTLEIDGYNAVQVTTGFKVNKKGEAKLNRVPNAIKGHYAKASQEIGLGLWEFRTESKEIGELSNFDVSIFGAGHYVDVVGRSKGKGFQGGVKRHNFSMQDATHGNSISHRAIGSTGQCQDPGRVFKGKKMAGHMGDEQIVEECLEVVRVDSDRNLLLIKGAIPGAKNGFVKVLFSDKKNATNARVTKRVMDEKAAKVDEIAKADEAAKDVKVDEATKVEKLDEVEKVAKVDEVEKIAKVEKANETVVSDTPKAAKS